MSATAMEILAALQREALESCAATQSTTFICPMFRAELVEAVVAMVKQLAECKAELATMREALEANLATAPCLCGCRCADLTPQTCPAYQAYEAAFNLRRTALSQPRAKAAHKRWREMEQVCEAAKALADQAYTTYQSDVAIAYSDDLDALNDALAALRGEERP